MGFFDKLFSNNNDFEPVEIDLNRAPRQLRDLYDYRIDDLHDEASNYQEVIEEQLNDIGEVLDEIEDFKDEKGRKAVNDISENIAEDRQEVLDEFNFSENPRDNLRELDNFLREFQEMKRKEAAVLEITSLQKDIAECLNNLKDIREEFEKFLEQKYEFIEGINEVEEFLNDREELKQEIEQLDDKINDDKIFKLRKRKEELENEIEEFKESESMTNYKEQKKDLEMKKGNLQDRINSIESSFSRMKRPLKKIIYQSENSDVSLDHIDTLRLIRDQETDQILQKEPDNIKSALDQLGDKGEISDLQREKLREGVKNLMDIEEEQKIIDTLKNEISNLEEKIQNHEAKVELEQKKNSLENLEEEIEQHKELKNETRSKIDQKKDEIKRKEKEIEEIIDNILDNPVEISKRDQIYL